MRRVLVFLPIVLFGLQARGQSVIPDGWSWKSRLEIRAGFRESQEERFQLRSPFPPQLLPPGQTAGFEETVDAGAHWEVSLVSLQLDAGYRDLLVGRLKFDAVDLYNRNPTSGDKRFDVDEIWVRLGPMPDGLDLPRGTSIFFQMGKAPKMERQPIRLLESYGLASNAFNRFNDVQFLLGGSFGRHVYWRGQVSSGNPLFFRDTNALAGDNGVKELLQPFPDPRLKSGFPVLYDAEVEEYFFEPDHPERGVGLGYRWRRDDGRAGFDLLVFDYRRTLAETVELNGTFYGGDLDLLSDPFGNRLPTRGNDRRETGTRLVAEWGGLAAIAQYVSQDLAGLKRSGYELESGYEIPLAIGTGPGGAPWISSIQPAARISSLINHFRGPVGFPAPSIWWDWVKTDVGLRVGFLNHYDLTVERSFHVIDSPRPVDLDETLVTFRIRL